MRLYRFLSAIFPNSFTLKVFFIAFVGTHVPLVAMVLNALLGQGSFYSQLPVLLPLLAATLVGTGVTLWALRMILAPVFAVQSTLQGFARDQAVTPLPVDFQDEVGSLMRAANHLIAHVTANLDAAEVEAHSDPLTGLLNRRGLEVQCRERPSGAALMIDVDRFKSINDTFGHVAGDKVLMQLADCLRECLRSSDLIGRYGGEEFVIFLPRTSGFKALEVAERLRSHISREVLVGERSVTVSIGVAIGRPDMHLSDLIGEADAAVYEAKRKGRDKVVLAD